MGRYSRQIILPKIREEGQKKLLESSVLIIGMGGLGSNIASSLVRAGIGTVKIVDRDFVEPTDLQRQILFDEKDIGKCKALVAHKKLKKINSSINIDAKVMDINYKNAEGIIKEVDLVLDGTDNLETRFVINDVCVKNTKPWIYGAAIGSVGMVMNILPKGPCLKCFIKKIPLPCSQLTCATAGVLNTILSIIASYEVTEAVKILLKDKKVCKDLIYIDVWNTTFNKYTVKKNKNCVCCVKKDFGDHFT